MVGSGILTKQLSVQIMVVLVIFLAAVLAGVRQMIRRIYTPVETMVEEQVEGGQNGTVDEISLIDVYKRQGMNCERTEDFTYLCCPAYFTHSFSDMSHFLI